MSATKKKTVNSIGARVLCERHGEKKMNHLILGAVFWVTGESGGTDGRLALLGTWPPAAGGKPKNCVISLDVGRERDAACTHTRSSTLHNQSGAVNLRGNIPLVKQHNGPHSDV